MKTIIGIAIFFGYAVVCHAEWYLVQDVSAYNKLKVLAEGESETPQQIRIRNLDRIEYIQNDSAQVLLGGESAIDLTKKLFSNQRVWVDNIQTEGGELVADVYPSYDRVMSTFKERHLVQGDNITKETLAALKQIYANMLKDLDSRVSSAVAGSSNSDEAARKRVRETLEDVYIDTLALLANASVQNKDKDSSNEYNTEHNRAEFMYDALEWYREKGQRLPTHRQVYFADWADNFLRLSDTDAKQTVVRISQLMDSFNSEDAAGPSAEFFLDQDVFDRGTFVYNALLWFKETGQFLPPEVQSLFVKWLGEYQDRPYSDTTFLRERILQMMENHELYRDFIF